jgi:hypothetical protein
MVMHGNEKNKIYAIGDPDKMTISFPNSGVLIKQTGEIYFNKQYGDLNPGKYTWFLPPKNLTSKVEELEETQTLLASGKTTSGWLFKVDLKEKKKELTEIILNSLKEYFTAIKKPNQAQRTEFFLMNGTNEQLHAAARGQTQ